LLEIELEQEGKHLEAADQETFHELLRACWSGKIMELLVRKY
jgi:hypothetical protein